MLKEQYDAGSQEDFPPNEDVHTVASLLKLYLKELPEPVVPFALYTSYTDAVKCEFFHSLVSDVSHSLVCDVSHSLVCGLRRERLLSRCTLVS